MLDEENVTTAAEEQTEAKKPRRKAAKTSGKAKGKKAKAAPRKAKAKKARKAKASNGTLALNEDRKDVYAALLRIRADGPRGKIIERLAKNSGKKFTAEQIGKWVDWDKRNVQHLMTVRVPYKLDKYKDAAKRIKLLAEGDGEYGLEVK